MPVVSGATAWPLGLKADFVRHGRILFGGLLLLLVASSAIYLKSDYERHSGEAAQRVATFADSMAEHVQQVLLIADLALGSIDDDRATPAIVPSRPLNWLHETLRAAQSQSPGMQGLGVLGEDGATAAAASAANPARVDLSDRDYFIHHRSHPDARLFIGRPVLSRPSNEPAIPVSRRIETTNGTFAGVIAARIDPKYFLRLFSSIGADGVAVFRQDGTAIARYPEVDLANAERLPPSSPVMARSRSEERGTFLGTSPIDGVQRLAAFRRIDSLGLIVTASNDMANVRRAWLARTIPFLLLVAGGVVFLTVVAWLVQRQARDAAALLAAATLAQRNAEHSAEVKAAFLANMSHEIRTPLGGIIGYADLLLKDEQPVRQKDWTVKLRSAGEQLLAVINDILDYSTGAFLAGHPLAPGTRLT